MEPFIGSLDIGDRVELQSRENPSSPFGIPARINAISMIWAAPLNLR